IDQTTMLGNCSIKLETENDISYLFQGESMLFCTRDFLLDGDILKCTTEDLFHKLCEGNIRIKDKDFFVIDLFTGETIVAKIIDVNIDREELQIRFLNPDKSKYPDRLMHSDDIKVIYRLAEVHRPYGSSIEKKGAGND